MSSPPNPIPDPPPEEEEIARLAALAALDYLNVELAVPSFPVDNATPG